MARRAALLAPPPSPPPRPPPAAREERRELYAAGAAVGGTGPAGPRLTCGASRVAATPRTPLGWGGGVGRERERTSRPRPVPIGGGVRATRGTPSPIGRWACASFPIGCWGAEVLRGAGGPQVLPCLPTCWPHAVCYWLGQGTLCAHWLEDLGPLLLLAGREQGPASTSPPRLGAVRGCGGKMAARPGQGLARLGGGGGVSCGEACAHRARLPLGDTSPVLSPTGAAVPAPLWPRRSAGCSWGWPCTPAACVW